MKWFQVAWLSDIKKFYHIVNRDGRSGFLIVFFLLLASLMEGVGVFAFIASLKQIFDSNTITLYEVGKFSILEYQIQVSLLGMLIAIFLLFFLKFVFMFALDMYVGYKGITEMHNMRFAIFKSLMQVNWQFYVSQSSGYYASIINSQTERASEVYVQSFHFFANLAKLVLYIVIIITVSAPAALVTIGSGLVIFFMYSKVIGMSRRLGQEKTTSLSNMSVNLVDYLANTKPIRAMNLSGHFSDILINNINQVDSASRGHIFTAAVIKQSMEPILVLVILILLIIMVAGLEVQIAESSVVLLLVYRGIGSVYAIQALYNGVALNIHAYQSLQSTIDELADNAEINYGTGKVTTVSDINKVTYQNISFDYQDKTIISCFNATFEKGTINLLLGKSGVGKTTLLDLLCKLHHPKTGKIMINDMNLSDIDSLVWRNGIGYVGQELVLLNTTVRENILLGVSISDEQWSEILHLSGVDQFIGQQWLDREVGEHGRQLSAGQRQRIALARALVRKPAILILDEPTSAMDRQTSTQFCKTMSMIARDVMVIMVTHDQYIENYSNNIITLEG